MNADNMLRRIQQKEAAYLRRKAGLPPIEQPVKQDWWETENEQEGQ